MSFSEILIVALGMGWCENASLTVPEMPWAWDVQRLDAAMRRDRAYLKKETRRVAGFLRIIICWFFESECLIENVVMNGREDIEIAGCPANIFLDFPCPFGVGSTFVKHPPVRRRLCLRQTSPCSAWALPASVRKQVFNLR